MFNINFWPNLLNPGIKGLVLNSECIVCRIMTTNSNGRIIKLREKKIMFIVLLLVKKHGNNVKNQLAFIET